MIEDPGPLLSQRQPLGVPEKEGIDEGPDGRGDWRLGRRSPRLFSLSPISFCNDLPTLLILSSLFPTSSLLSFRPRTGFLFSLSLLLSRDRAARGEG